MTQPTLKPGKSAHSDVTDKVKQDAETAMAKAAEAGSDAKATAKAKAKEKTEEGTGIVADEMESVAHAAQSAAGTLDEEQHSLMSERVAGWADDLATFASDLRERSADDLIRDARKFARKSPAGFLLGTIAVGFVAARFSKATATRSHGHRDEASTAVSTDGAARADGAAPYSGTDSRDPDDQPIPRTPSTPAASTTDGPLGGNSSMRRGENL